MYPAVCGLTGRHFNCPRRIRRRVEGLRLDRTHDLEPISVIVMTDLRHQIVTDPHEF